MKTAHASFQRVMDNILKGIDKMTLVYMDDINLYSSSFKEHLYRLGGTVFKKLRRDNMEIELDKSELLRKELTYLGHIITETNISKLI